MIVEYRLKVVDMVDGVSNIVILIQMWRPLHLFRNRGLHDSLGQWTRGSIFVASFWEREGAGCRGGLCVSLGHGVESFDLDLFLLRSGDRHSLRGGCDRAS